MPRYSRVSYHQKGPRTYLSLKITKNRSTACVELTGGYCWSSSFNVLGVLFLGAVSSAFLPSKTASWTPKFRHLGVDQQYPGVFRAYAARANPCCTMRQQTSPLPLGKTLGQTGLTPGRIRVSAQCLMAHQRHHGGRCTDTDVSMPYRCPRALPTACPGPSKAAIF
jgi:hypothetical protein